MEEPPAKAFVKQFLRAAKLEVFESNLNIELLGKMNLVTAQQYEEVLKDAERVERELTVMSSANAELHSVIAEIAGLGPVLQELEHSIHFLEDVTTKLEQKLKGVQGLEQS